MRCSEELDAEGVSDLAISVSSRGPIGTHASFILQRNVCASII